MAYGFLRLLMISAATVAVTVAGLAFVRWLGLAQSFGEPPHPWFAMKEWRLYQPEAGEICLSKTLPSSVAPDEIAWLTIKFKNGAWTLPCENGPLPPTDVLRNSRHSNWLLHVEAVETAHLNQLTESLSAFDKTKLFGVYSGSQTVARYLRKQAPQWLFAADAAALLRLHLFTSLWIETAFDFWPDFVVLKSDDKNAKLNERERHELERRHKRIIEAR